MEHQSQTRSFPKFLNDRILQFGTEDLVGLIVSYGMDSFGEENDFYFTNETEENAHSGNLGGCQAFGCMVENCSHLLDGDAREPLHKLSDFYSIFEVLKER
jgi:hypothetical protein